MVIKLPNSLIGMLLVRLVFDKSTLRQKMLRESYE